MDELEVEFELAENPGIEAEFILGEEAPETDHSKLINRDLPDQHPISAITGLQDELDSKQDKLIIGNYLKLDKDNRLTTTYTAGRYIDIDQDGKIDCTLDSSEELQYENWRNPEVATVKDALDAALYYNYTDFKGGTINEIGTEVTELTFEWNYNASVVNKIEPLVGQVITGSPYTFTFEQPLTENTEFTLSIYKQGHPEDSITSSTQLIFLPKIYWGVSSNLETPSDEEILGYNSKLAVSRFDSEELEFNCDGGKYLVVAIPTKYCDERIHFFIGGIICSDYEVTTRDFTNAKGYTQPYNIYVFNTLQHSFSMFLGIL